MSGFAKSDLFGGKLETQQSERTYVPGGAPQPLAQYKDTGDTSARDRLVFSLAPVVKCIVYRKVREIPSHREVDDFISCGLEALIRSIDRYDPDKGATLEQFAWTRIHGAVLDELRRFDGRRARCGAWSGR